MHKFLLRPSAAAVAVTVLLVGGSAQERAPVDLVIRNARIFTGESPAWADAAG